MAEAFRSARFGNAEWRTIDTRTKGSTAYETGTYAFVVFNSAERSRPQTLKGRYFVVWKRAAGCWKIAYDASQPGAAG
jgi:ketosteroid isomerase-like protein